MSSTFLTDICDLYINEVIQPQLGKPSAEKPAPAAPAASGPRKVEKGKEDSESSAKRIRQAVYDIRYRARRENIPLEQAFNQYMAHTSMGGSERTAVREKLGLSASGGGSSSPVKEEYVDEANKPSEQKFKVRVSDKTSGKSYVRYATRSKIEQLRKNPNISSVEMTGYGEPYEGEKQKGERTAAAKAGKDWDGDGKVESGSKEHAGVVHNAIQKAKGGVPDGQDTRKKVRKESYSNWRTDLIEIVNDVEASKKIGDKKVNNYKNKVVTINPEVQENFQIVEMVELDEEYLNETVDIATEYFFNQGLNEEGLDIVIEELGLEKFNDFVFYVAEDYELTEARAAKRRKSTKSVEQIKAEIDAREAAKKKPVAKKITADKGAKAVEKAKETQPSKKPVRDAIARGVFGAVKAYQQGMERHRAATATAGKAVKVAAKGASEFGKGVASGVKATTRAAQAVHKVLKNSYEIEGDDIQEVSPPGFKGTVKAMKKHPEIDNPFALAWYMKKKGFKSHKKASGASKNEEYEHVDEAISKVPGRKTTRTSSTQRRTELQQARNSQRELVGEQSFDIDPGAHRKQQRIEKATQLRNKTTGGESGAAGDAIRRMGGSGVSLPVQKAHYEPEGDQLDENPLVGLGIKAGLAAGTALAGKKVYDSAKGVAGKLQQRNQQTQKAIDSLRNSYEPEGEVVEQIRSYPSTTPIRTAPKPIQSGPPIRTAPKPIQSGSKIKQMNSYEPEGELIDERRRSEKGTPRKPRDKAFELVAKSMGASRMGVEPRGQKKVPGKKPPAAGEYGSGVKSPAQKVALRRAAAERAKDAMSSRFD